MLVGGEKRVTFEYARRSPGTRLIIVSDDKVLLTKEFRREHGGWDYRLPGGKVFDRLADYNAFLKSKGDLLMRAKQAAKREAREEVGLKVKKLKHYHTSKCGATVDWDLFYFIVREFEMAKEGQRLEHGEEIEPVWLSFNMARETILKGKMKEDRSVGVLLRYLDSQ